MDKTGTTKELSQQHYYEIRRKSRKWVNMSESELFAEARAVIPSLSESTSLKYLRYLMLKEFEKSVGD